MKPGEPILTGMRVWHESGTTAHVISVVVTVGKQLDDGTWDWNSETEVQVSPEGSVGLTETVPLAKFVKQYHLRTTGWERLDDDRITPPQDYEGPLKGYHVIKLGWGDVIVRIPKRERTPPERIRQEEDDAHRLSGSYSSWFEHFEPAPCWKLVLDPTL